jgi:hypothetical protein
MDVDREFDTDEFFQALSSGNNTSTIDTDDTDHDPWNEVRRKRNKKKERQVARHLVSIRTILSSPHHLFLLLRTPKLIAINIY